MSEVKASEYEAALRAMLADGDLLHVPAQELARYQETDCGLIGAAAWKKAQAVCVKYEPLRALYQRREPPAHIHKPQASCLLSDGIDLWRLRYDLFRLPICEKVLVGSCLVQRVRCDYGTRWLIGDNTTLFNEFDALMALKGQYMDEQVQAQPTFSDDIAALLGWAVLRAGKVTPDALAVYANLLRFAADDTRNGEPPTNKELGAACGINDKRVRVAVDELVTRKLIAVESREGRPPLYAFLGKLSTPVIFDRGHSYIYKSQESLQEGNQESAPLPKSTGVAKVDANPEETKAINALLTAWVSATGSGKSPYKNKTMRAEALNLHKFGVTDNDVRKYVDDLRTNVPWHKKNNVSWSKVVDNVRAWAGKLSKPEAAPKPAATMPTVDYGGL